MLLLLPPSEGKTAPSPRRAPADLGALWAAGALGAVRRQVLDAVDPALRDAPAAPAREVYSGVLFARAQLDALDAAGRRRADRDVRIASALWGLVRPSDRIPAYKLPIATKVPLLGSTLAALWRPAVAAALEQDDVPGGLVVDCRSGGYAAVWRPRAATLVEVRAFRVAADGSRQVISHMAKASRGDVASVLLRTPGRAPRTPQAVAALLAGAGMDVELTPQAGGIDTFTLDVLER